MKPIGIRSSYDEGKRGAETLTFDYHHQFGLNIRVARIFNTHGPIMDAKNCRVVSNFIAQALNGEPITIYGDGSQTRSSCYVSYLMEGLTKLFFAEKVHEPIKLGNLTPINIKQLAEEVLTLTVNNSKLTHKELPGDDPKQREPSISNARELLGWHPKVNRIAGLTSTVEFFKTQI